MTRWNSWALGLLIAVNGFALRAQDDATGEGRIVVVNKEPTPEQLSEKLDQVKTTILPRVWHPKCDKDPSYRKKYLAKWQAVVSEHYVVFTDGPTTTCKRYSVTLEELYAAIKKELPFEDPDHLLVAYIFADEEDYFRYAEHITGYSAEGARQTAGHATSYFYATYYSSPHSPVVFHEAAHEVVGACLRVPGVGSWFQEGLAVYFESKMSNAKIDARADIKSGHWYPLAEFFDIRTLLSDPKGNGRRSYQHAGALIDFMINTKLEPVAGKFTDFLAAARKGYGYEEGKKVSARLIKTTYGLTIDEFQDLWLRDLRIK